MVTLFILESSIVFLLFGCGIVFSSGAQYPVLQKELIPAELNETNLNPSDYEIVHQMAHNPDFIYSAFMTDRLDRAESITAKCHADVWRVVLDVALFKVYAVKSKYSSLVMLLGFFLRTLWGFLKNLKFLYVVLEQ